MFKPQFATGAVGISKAELAREKLLAYCEAHPVSAELVAPLRMPENIREIVQEDWEDYCRKTEDQGSLEDVSLEVEIHPSRHGFVIVVLEPEKNSLKVLVRTVDFDSEEVLREVSAGTAKTSKKTQHKADVAQTPNSAEQAEGAKTPVIHEQEAGRPKEPMKIQQEDRWLDEIWEPLLPSETRTATRKVPLNARCPCGSGKKYKKCCGRFS